MCARYEFSGRSDDNAFLQMVEELTRRNIAFRSGEIRPGDTAAVLASDRSLQIRAFAMQWGYRLPDGKLIFNARSETASQKSLFFDGMARRRCLIPAERYYEWLKSPEGSTRYALRPVGSESFFLAGIYRHEEGHYSFTVLTRAPGESIAFLHDRMPVILPDGSERDWLNPRYRGEEILKAALTDPEYMPWVS